MVRGGPWYKRCVPRVVFGRVADERLCRSLNASFPGRSRWLGDVANEHRSATSSTDARAEDRPKPRPKTSSKPDVPRARSKRPSVGEQLQELKRISIENEGVVAPEAGIVDKELAKHFPLLDMTSLAGENVVIRDAAANAGVTLVLIAFRSFAEEQLVSWREPFENTFGREEMDDSAALQAQIFDVSINETFAAQSLSGFIQRIQRSRIDHRLHRYHVALNSDAGAELETVLPSKNRLFGSALLLDRDGRVRFRVAGKASPGSRAALIAAAERLLAEDRSPGVVGIGEDRLTSSSQSGKRGYKGREG